MNNEYENRERPTEQTNANNQQMVGQQQQQQQHFSQQESESDQVQRQSQSQAQQQQISESYYEPVMSDPPSSLSNSMAQQSNSNPVPPEPVIPSMETIQKNLGFPSHSVILMILPSTEELSTNSKKSVNKTKSESNSEEESSSGSENKIRTNAMKIGSKLLNPKGWKPGLSLLDNKSSLSTELHNLIGFQCQNQSQT